MKGLLIKDFCNLKKYLKQVICIIILYAALGMFSKSYAIMGAVTIVLGAMMVLTSISYDEQAKWDKYALTMPISRNDIVKSKYLFLLISTLIGCILSFLMGFGLQKIGGDTPIIEVGLVCAIVTEFVFLAFSIILPLVFQFGVEKSRIWMIAIMMLPTIIIVFFSKYIMPHTNLDLEKMKVIGKNLFYVSPLITIVILIVSYKISLQIFEKKAF